MEQGRNEENPLQLERPLEMANHQPPQAQKCPRCDSFNTKFCYYNNYSLSQPRHFCKTCRRYWTQGGTLRNVPVGGGYRKSKRGRTMSSNSLAAEATQGLPPAIRTQSFTRMTSDQPSRHVAPLIDNSFFTGGSFLSSLAAMHTLPTNQGVVPVNIDGNGGQFGGNMTILQGGVSLPFLKSPTSLHQYSPSSTHYFQPQQSLVRPGTFNSWNQGLINKGGASSSSVATTSSFLNGNDQSSFAPNQWSYTHSEFNPF